MTLFRYPGSKKKIKKIIVEKTLSLFDEKTKEYREPFFGGGSVGLDFLEQNLSNLFNKINSVWINDLDVGVACLWTAVIRHCPELKEKIKTFNPSTEHFYGFRNFLHISNIENYRRNIISPKEIVDIGFKKIALHQMSYSGLGVMSGGPIGGKSQTSNYKIDCRWKPELLCKKIDKINDLLKNFQIKEDKCSAHDFENLLHGNDAVVYLDPPYYEQGNVLYQFAFKKDDHVRLSNFLKSTKNKWILSYDNCQEIRDMYRWAKIEEIQVSYTITGIRNKKELLIYRD
jgi:DNA adenine methylase